MCSWFTYRKMCFSIVMLVYQRVIRLQPQASSSPFGCSMTHQPGFHLASRCQLRCECLVFPIRSQFFAGEIHSFCGNAVAARINLPPNCFKPFPNGCFTIVLAILDENLWSSWRIGQLVICPEALWLDGKRPCGESEFGGFLERGYPKMDGLYGN